MIRYVRWFYLGWLGLIALTLYLTREAWKVAKVERAPAPGLEAVRTAEALKT